MSTDQTAGVGRQRCPVCPFDRLTDDMLVCPSCATDLTALRRVQELPVLLLNDAVGQARAGDVERAIAGLLVAARFSRTRGRALLLLGKCEAWRGNEKAALEHWTAAAAAGEESAAAKCLETLTASRPASKERTPETPRPLAEDSARRVRPARRRRRS